MTADEFWARVSRSAGPGGCWPWLGTLNDRGYGRSVVVAGKKGRPHRHAVELTTGPISAGLEVDHLCRTRRCCNPAHLEAVTHVENMRRARGLRVRPATCPQGHPHDPNDPRPPRQRGCRVCGRAYAARKYAERRLAHPPMDRSEHGRLAARARWDRRAVAA